MGIKVQQNFQTVTPFGGILRQIDVFREGFYVKKDVGSFSYRKFVITYLS